MKIKIPKLVKTKTHPVILHTTESKVGNIPEYIGIKEGRVITDSKPLIRDIRDKMVPNPDEKLGFTLHTATDIPSREDRWVASRVQDNYQNAMSRRRDYIFPYVGDGVLAGTYGFKGDDGSLLVDLPGKSAKTHNEIFIPSHFAPESLKGGAKLLKLVSASSQPVLIAVTEDLAPMLRKLQFEEIGVHQAPFEGEMVDKHLMVNRAFLDYVKNNENNTKNILLNLLESTGSDDFIEMSKELKPILENAVESSHRVKNSPKPTVSETKYPLERPELTTYKLEDLIGYVPYPYRSLRLYLESGSKRNGGILNYLSYLNI